ncbi:uncharacterized protein A4U43_C10F8880 [Asparagus officinalis]|uniref:DUF4283 domain-containing protein n=1 Tax=Asparagus officinalis TaxID=4686 RepID=A0A5P1E1J0_ASPOF|nr:uncharacterized protein A4U43_C10F8880 [Asparagus officinalis]
MVSEGLAIPFIGVDREQKRSLRHPWRFSVIVKVLGRLINFNILQQRLLKLWHFDEESELIDLGYGFYIVKLSDKEGLARILTGGPWKIMDHYLLVQRWKPNFKPSIATVSKAAVWVRLPELPIEYFNVDFLMGVGKLLGTPIKLDTNITMATRGKFARICVEVDLAKPLIAKVKIGGFTQTVFDVLRDSNGGEEPGNGDSVNGDATKKESTPLDEIFGPWMLAQRKSGRGSGSRNKKVLTKDFGRESNRFHALDDEEEFVGEQRNTHSDVAIWSKSTRGNRERLPFKKYKEKIRQTKIDSTEIEKSQEVIKKTQPGMATNQAGDFELIRQRTSSDGPVREGNKDPLVEAHVQEARPKMLNRF